MLLVWQAEDQARKQGLHIMLQTQLEAAVAAALAGKEGKQDSVILRRHT